MIKKRALDSGGVRYDVRLRNPADPSKEDSRTFRTLREAQGYEAQQRADRSRGLSIDPRRAALTVGEWADQWLTSNPAKRPSALARDETIVRLHVKPALGSRPIGAVRKPDVQRVVNAWTATHAPRTVHRMFGVVRAIFRAAVDSDYLGRTPCRGINLPEASEIDKHIVSAEELADLANAMPAGLALMPYVGAVLGLRWGEVAGLRVEDLNFLEATLTVSRQRTRGPRGSMVEGPPKSDAGRRTMSVPAELMLMLSTHLAERRVTAADGLAYVFVGAEGLPLDYSHWRQRVWLPATKRAGLGGLHFHDLRSACATGMVAEGVDVRTAQARLGHSDPRLTLGIYARATREGDEAAAQRMGARLLRGSPETRGELRRSGDLG